MGLGSSSYLGEERFRNPNKMDVYLNAINAGNLPALRCERQILTADDKMEEFMFLGLRMAEGISEREFERRFGIRLEDKFGDVLRRHLAQKVIRRISSTGDSTDGRNDIRIALTEYGMDVANYVMADYIL